MTAPQEAADLIDEFAYDERTRDDYDFADDPNPLDKQRGRLVRLLAAAFDVADNGASKERIHALVVASSAARGERGTA